MTLGYASCQMYIQLCQNALSCISWHLCMFYLITFYSNFFFFIYAPMCLGQLRHKGDAIDALHGSGDGAVIDPLKRGEERSNSSCYVNPTPSSEWALDPNTSWQLGLARAKPPPFCMGPEIRTAPAPGMGSSRSLGGSTHGGESLSLPCSHWVRSPSFVVGLSF